ncbi:MAG TPA: hypothetical protein C5S51_06915 [Methanosarcinaceae archaeon]|nr:hypothetical protein [Methanosarcinaceae archaeon]
MHVEGIVSKEINVIPFTGYYKNENEFIKDAVNTLLTARKDLRIAVACELYKREEVSFGKACEIASLDIEEMKEVLHKKGIARKVSATPKNVSDMANEAIRLKVLI